MADSPANPSPTTEPDPEVEFWKKHRENTVGILNEWWETHKPEAPVKTEPAKTGTGDSPKPEPPAPGTSRTGGKRVTLPGLIADMVFGPNKGD